MGDRWTLAIALELAPGRTRLSHLRERLAVGSSVLDRYVRQMQAVGLVRRSRFREKPPRVEVELTEAGLELLPIACALARWGMRYAWSGPEPDEHVDLDALLRMLPVLLERTALPAGEIEFVVEDPQRAVSRAFEVDGGRLRPAPIRQAGMGIDEGAGARGVGPSARVAGTRAAWIAALGPAGDRSTLEIAGDADLAASVLDGVHASV